MMQTYYHTQETVCSNARSLLLSVLSLLQIPETCKNTPTHQRGKKRDKELTKSASVIDPAALQTPTSHHHPMSTMRGTTSTRTPYYSSRCHRWEMSRRRELQAMRLFMLSQNPRVCGMRTA